MANNKIRLAIIGAGKFALTAHMPVLEIARSRFDVVAVASRTLESATTLASKLSGHRADATDDIDTVLNREDVDAVDVVVPIHLAPDIITKALKARKHVFSEKPIAPSVDIGRELIAVHQQYQDAVWMVGEHMRYNRAIEVAAELICSGAIGTPRLCDARFLSRVKAPMSPLRSKPSYEGGYMLDGGVHYVAMLRALLGEIANVTAVTTRLDDTLPAPDTLVATLQFSQSVIGTATFGFSSKYGGAHRINIIGDRGRLEVGYTQVRIYSDSRKRRQFTYPMARALKENIGARIHGQYASFFVFTGVVQEFEAFSDAIINCVVHRNTAAEALKDVAVVEALITAAACGATVCPQTSEEKHLGLV